MVGQIELGINHNDDTDGMAVLRRGGNGRRNDSGDGVFSYALALTSRILPRGWLGGLGLGTSSPITMAARRSRACWPSSALIGLDKDFYASEVLTMTCAS